MPHNVIQSFFENEKHFPAKDGIRAGFAFIAIKRERNRKRNHAAQVVNMAAYPADQVEESIMPRIDGPNNVADRIDYFTRKRADLLEGLTVATIISLRLLNGEVAPDGNRRKA